jgi:D-aspartate ligase
MAVVMGDVDMVRALGLAGIQSSYFGLPTTPRGISRHVRAVLPWLDEWRCQQQIVTALLRFARAQPEPPVLYPQTDAAVLLTSRYRESCGAGFASSWRMPS